MVIAIDVKAEDEKFLRFTRQVLDNNERTTALTVNEIIFLRNRYREGKKFDEVTI